MRRVNVAIGDVMYLSSVNEFVSLLTSTVLAISKYTRSIYSAKY